MAVPAYTITLVTDSQEENPLTENLINTFDVNFSVPSLNYASTITVQKTGSGVVADAKKAVEDAIALVAQIYALGQAPPPAA